MSEPILRQGEVVTCENGHEVCTVVADLFPETMNWGANFGLWQQPEPMTGQQLPLYCVCGAPYMAQTVSTQHYEIEGYPQNAPRLEVAAQPIHAFIKGRGWVPPIPEDLGSVPRKGDLE